MSAPAPLTDPALLRTLIRSLPATPSPGPTIPASEQGGKSPHRRKRVPQPHTSASITTPWNDTLIPMSSQLPPPQPGRSTTMPDEDDLELAPEPRGLLRAIRSWYHRHPMIVDISIAAGVIVYTLVTGIAFLLRPSSPVKTYPILPLALIAIALLGIALALRRRCPVWSWAAILLIPEVYQFAVLRFFHFTTEQQLYATLGVSGMGLMSLPFALGTIASHRRPAAAWTAGAISLAVLTADLSLTTPSMTVGELLRTTVILVLFILVGILVGFNARSARLRLKAMELRSTRMALASEQAALLAAAEERSRIAREMHDVVAHSLAVMITMADAPPPRWSATRPRPSRPWRPWRGRTQCPGRHPPPGGGPARGPLSRRGADHRLAGLIGTCLLSRRGQRGTALRPARPRQPPPLEPDGQECAVPGALSPLRGLLVVPPARGPRPAGARVRPPGDGDAGRAQRPHRQPAPAGHQRCGRPLPRRPAPGPLPEQADITELVKRFEAAGVPVTYRWVGAALPEDKALQLTVFRIAQEALTNVLRYAPTTPAVSVDVERHVGTVVLTVDNGGRPPARARCTDPARG